MQIWGLRKWRSCGPPTALLPSNAGPAAHIVLLSLAGISCKRIEKYYEIFKDEERMLLQALLAMQAAA